MAYVGEVVKLENGRWARFQHCPVVSPEGTQRTILVAVELSASHQALLDEAAFALSDHSREGRRARVEFPPGEGARPEVSVASAVGWGQQLH